MSPSDITRDLERGLVQISRPLPVAIRRPPKEEPLPPVTLEKIHVGIHSYLAPKLEPPKRPEPMKPNISVWIRLALWFNTYRKFFCLVLLFNFVSFAITATGGWNYPRAYTGAFILGNLQVAVLVRNELVCRFLYLVTNTFFAKWTPLWFRLACTSTLQHLGGVHSGCALSAFIWLLFRVTTIIHESPAKGHAALLVSGVLTTVAISISLASAIPWVRNAHHNTFERFHRFAGWTGLILTWIFVALSHRDLSGSRVFRQQDVWFAFVMSILVITPWCTVRQVPVHVEIPSDKVAILRFDRGMQQGLLSRISRDAVTEYHAFGIVSEGPNAESHYLVCGVQGDFTRRLVEDPPIALWTRQLKFAGVSNTSSLYKRGVRVCTGTGIGAGLSTCLQDPNWYLIWIGADLEKTFGPTIFKLIHAHIGPERMTLWDSRARGGRPDVLRLIRKVYWSWSAEVVFITSNGRGNDEMMQGCKSLGIPAFGTLFDF